MSLGQTSRQQAGHTPLPASAPLRIRIAAPADARACGRIMHDAFEGIAAAHGFPKDFDSRRSATQLASSLIADPSVFGVVAEADGTILGSNFVTEGDPIRGVGPITVEPSRQDEGVGRRLMEAILERSEGAPGVRLVQDAFNTRSMALYALLGFAAKEPLLLLRGAPRAALPRGAVVRPMTESDLAACDALCEAAHGITRGHELRNALPLFGPLVLDDGRRVTGYLTAPGLWLANHGVAESEEDMIALLAGAAEHRRAPVSLLLPSRQAGLLRWSLGAGMRVVKPMTLMAQGAWREPARCWFPSVFY